MVYFSRTMAITVDLKLFTHYYPLSNGLDKLYIGAGGICDFIMYSNDENTPQDIAISVMPVLGWKCRIMPFLMVDPFVGGKFVIMKTDNYKDVDNYLSGGFQWGINFLLFISNTKKLVTIQSIP